MLGRLLHPLDRKEQTLLLCMLSMGGDDADALLSLLPDSTQARLDEKREKLATIPTEKRVPLMIRQLKQLMGFRGATGLEGVEPSWLIAGFRGESPRTVAIVLMHMPSSIARQISSRLPEDIRNAMPSRAELKALPLDLVKLVRNRFNNKFASMPSDRVHDQFSFRDLILLNPRELILLIRKLGLQELAVAFIAVGKRALAAFLSRLPPDNAEELMTAVKRAAGNERIDQKDAQAFLGRILKNFNNVDELFQKAGLYRLGHTIQEEDQVFVRQLQQRFPRAHGRLLADYLDRVRARASARAAAHAEDEAQEGAANVAELRDSVLDMVVELSQRGKIDQKYAAAPTVFEAR